jgi:dihydrofolate reductase
MRGNVVANKRKIIVHIATSADGYIARPDGDIEWLTNRPAPKGFYGIGTFVNSIDTKLLGRKTFDLSVQMGAAFETTTPHYVFSRRPPPAPVPAGVEFIAEDIGAFAKRLRTGNGKNIWMMGGGEIIASFLDAGAIDEFIISVIPTFIGEGIPLMAHRHRHLPLRLESVRRFSDGVVQVHYKVKQKAGSRE